MDTNYRHPKHARIEQLILKGWSDKRTAAEVHAAVSAVARVRRMLGVAPLSNASSLSDKLLDHMVHQDGHVLWSGRTGRFGVPLVRHRGKEYGVRRLVFEAMYERPPVGMVKADCDESRCVKGRHLVDDPMRAELRSQLRSLTGMRPMTERCINGHDMTTHGRLSARLVQYCAACNSRSLKVAS
jgi:hypothetical protein